jgi:hypothetical protein
VAVRRLRGDHVAGQVDMYRQIEQVLAESADRTPTDLFWPRRLEQTMVMLREQSAAQWDQVHPTGAGTSPVRR